MPTARPTRSPATTPGTKSPCALPIKTTPDTTKNRSAARWISTTARRTTAPTAITLNAGDSASYWVKAESGGATVGKLGVSDPDSGDTHTYTVSDSRFEITADGTLKLKDGQSVHYGEEKRIQLTVTATDNHGAAYSRDIAVQVKDEGNKGAASPLPAAPRAVTRKRASPCPMRRTLPATTRSAAASPSPPPMARTACTCATATKRADARHRPR